MTQPLDGATLLATVDGIDYYQVAWVVRQATDGAGPSYYCTPDAWPATAAGKLATKDQEIRELRAKVALLEQRLSAAPVPPTVAAAATGMSTPEKRAGGANGRVVCPACGKKLWPAALATHLCTPAEEPPTETDPLDLAAQLAPVRPPAREKDVQLPPATPPPLIYDGWRCAVCQSDVYAPTAADPTVCIRCAKARQNGHAAEVGAK